MSDETRYENSPRRGFLKRVATLSGALPLSQGLAGGAGAIALIEPAAAAATSASQLHEWVGYTSLGPEEAAFTEALVNTMCPADEFTPDGVACGLAVYIDRQLAGSFGKGAKRYRRGPWAKGKPQHGDQLPLTPEQHFKSGAAAASRASERRFGKAFDQLAATDANTFLDDLAAGKVVDPELDLASWFNELVYPLFEQACFADPIYGGNRDKAFWKLIGYPGLPATNTLNMVQFRGKPFPGARAPRSIADFS